MNDRFLFRIYNKRTKSWLYGPGNEIHLFGENVLLGNFGSRVDLEDLFEYVIFQCSGRKDRNGKKIFEGDILRGKMDFGPAGWHTVTLPLYFDDERGYQWNDWELTTLEVLGTVYDNPELLK